MRLEAGAVGARQAVGQAHGVGRGPRRQAALRQRLRHGLLPAQRRRQGQLRHSRHGGRGPARVVGVEGAQAVAHGGGRGRGGGRELGQARRGQQRAGGAEHVGGLLALLPLGPPVLEPDLPGGKEGDRTEQKGALETLSAGRGQGASPSPSTPARPPL